MSRLFFRCWFPGKPKGKERPRARVIGKHATIYTPKETKDEERRIANLAAEVMEGTPPTKRPVRVDLIIAMKPTESWPAWKKELCYSGRMMPTIKPDDDNVEKLVKDALNGVVWVDDAQSVQCTKQKIFAEKEGVRVEVRELTAYPAGIKTKKEMDGF